MSKLGDAMSIYGGMRMLLGVRGVLEGLPRMFVSSQVILLSVLLRGAMGVRGAVVQLGGLLVVLVM